jgi:hypothetical protein
MRGGSCAYFPVTGRTAVARRSGPWDDGRRSWRARRAGKLADTATPAEPEELLGY